LIYLIFNKKIMRALLLSITIFFISKNINAQEHFCCSTEAQNEWFKQHPELKTNFDLHRQQASDRDKEFFNTKNQQKSASLSSATYTIPIVFHILHTGGGENISDAQVMDAVNILNRDYRKLNADTIDVVPAFSSIIGDAKISFSLVTKDPNGNCTNGIVRHYDSKTNWTQSNFSYYNYTWDPTKYLNIYVVKSLDVAGTAAYTYLPGSGIPSVGDAIVVRHNYLGNMGTGNLITSRTLTHEVGHWFGLPHVWGFNNQPGVVCGDEGISDTPITKGFTSCNLGNSDQCNPGVEENLQNYMDYSFCNRMFTIGQANEMQNAASSSINGRNNLSSSLNLFNTGITDPQTACAPKLEIAAQKVTICSGESLNLYSYLSNASAISYSWVASNGAVIANSQAANTSITFNSPGTATVNCTASNVNGSSTGALVINVLNGVPNITSNNAESFENVAIPANWAVINNTTPDIKWEITSIGAYMGVNSVFIAGEELPANSIEILESPSYDFKNNQGAKFSFKYAYAKYDNTNKDVFKVMASKDCGGTWIDVWSPSNTSMANNSGGVTTTLLVPTTEWVTYNVSDESPYFGLFEDEPNVRFRFFFQGDVGSFGFGNSNRMYLDDISFTAPVGINEITKSIGLNIYPNPTSSAFKLSFNLSDAAIVSYEVTSITGTKMIQAGEKEFSTGSHELSINDNNQLAQGIYFLNLEVNGIKMIKKIIIN
jgi:hypothetical protein